MTDDLVTPNNDNLMERLGSYGAGRGTIAATCRRAKSRIEEQAATIARLTEQSAMWKESAENYRWAAREAIDAAKEMLADRKAAEAKVAALVEALREIAAEASVPVHTGKNGINFKKMYEGWRKIAVERIDIARAAIAAAKGGTDGR